MQASINRRAYMAEQDRFVSAFPPGDQVFTGNRRSSVLLDRRANAGQVAIRRVVSVAAALVISDAVSIAGCIGVPWLRIFRLPYTHRFAAAGVLDGSAMTVFIIIASVPLLCLFFLASGHYDRQLPFLAEARQAIEASAVAGVLAALHLHLSKIAFGPSVISAWSMLPLILLINRQIAKLLLAQFGLSQESVVVVGDASGIEASLAAFAEAKVKRFNVLEVISIDQWSVERATERWDAVLDRSGASRIVFAASLNCQRDWAVIQSIVQQRVPFSTFSSLSGLPMGSADHLPLIGHNSSLLHFRNTLAQPVARMAKGVFDFLLAGCMLVVTLPLLGAVAVLVSLDGGPVLFSQTRIGRSGQLFRCLKFRTMAVDADRILRELLLSDRNAAAEWAATQKLRNDPRVTRVGRVLRKTSIDELPQLLNVLRFEMSLVGPRPIVDNEEARYGDQIGFYHETRPGLTGLWQISGRSTTTYAKRVQLDAWYVSNWSPWLDIAILLRTVPALLSRRGAV